MGEQVAGVIDFDLKYKVDGSEGIAYYLLGYVTTRDEDYEWTGYEIEDRTKVRAVMVGDDHVWEVDVDDLTPIGDNEYCPECGQIGCKAYG